MFWSKRKQADFSAEIEAHLQLEIERLRERGLSADEAETAARLRFGNVTRAEERFYESGRWLWWERLKQDVRFGLRMLKRNPAFSAVAVLTLALGIGANTAIFSLIQAVLLRPLPFPEPDRLASVWERRPSSREANLPVSAHEYMAWRQESQVFSSLALYHSELPTITGHGEPATVNVLRVSADLFPVLGVPAALGRTILPGEDRAGENHVAVLSDAFWRRRFAADAKIVGQTITLDNQGYSVVGVMPSLPETLSPDVWLPMDLPGEAQRVGRHSLSVMGRLKPGITLAQAQSALDVVAGALEQRLPQDNTNHKVKVFSAREDLTGDVRGALVALMGVVGCVLLIACLNVAGLLLTRASVRRREIAIRTALGASRPRLIRQLVTESLLLSGIGGILGLVLAVWLVRLLPHIQGVSIPLVETIAVDRPVLIVTAFLSLLSGLAAGVAPALRASRTKSVARMSEGKRISAEPDRRRLGAALVATQVALALVLLVGAALLMKSFVRLVNVETGFNTQHVLVTSVALPGPKYPHAGQSRSFFDALMERIKTLPGVESVGSTTDLPLQGTDNWIMFSIEGRPPAQTGHELSAPMRVVSPDYFRALGIPLRAGRLFNAGDARLAVPLIRWYPEQPNPANFDKPQPIPAAIISEAMARQYWPDENPIGRRFRVLFSPWITIVGVVGDVKHNALDAPSYPHIYLPYMQEPSGEMTLVIRTAGEPLLSANAVREQIRGMDAGLPVAITEMNQVLSGSVGRQRFYMVLAGVFGALALGLAVVGIFGLASYSVSQRIGEIGLRMALGAQRTDILWMVLGQGMLPTLAGAVLGSGGALALAVVIKSFLYQVSPADPVALAAALLLIMPVALIASYIPARRAMRVDPNVALRCE